SSSIRRPPPRSTLFPYTTLFRSVVVGEDLPPRIVVHGVDVQVLVHRQPHRGRGRTRRLGTDCLGVRRDQELRELLLRVRPRRTRDRKSTRLNSSHVKISYAVFCL